MDSAILDLAILGSPMVTIQAEVTMLTVPVAMVTAWLPWKYRGFCINVPSFDHVTRDPRDRPWWLALVDAEPLYFHTTHILRRSLYWINFPSFNQWNIHSLKIYHRIDSQKKYSSWATGRTLNLIGPESWSYNLVSVIYR